MPAPKRAALAGASQAPRARVLALLLLLVVATMPSGPAQDVVPPQVILDRRDVLEGGNVSILVRGYNVGDAIQVRCARMNPDGQACPDGTYTALARDRPLKFPDDFGEEARRLRQPRWNATWEVTLLKNGVAPVVGPTTQRIFNSTIVDIYKFPDREVEPGDRILIGGSGYLLPDQPVRITITKTNSTAPSRQDLIWAFDPIFPLNGTVRAGFRFSPELARLVRCPEDPFERCRHFTLRIEGGGKNTEQMRFYARPAQLQTKVVEEPSPGEVPTKVNRTLTPNVKFQLTFRSQFDWLTFLDYGFGKGPKYHVERLTGDEVVQVEVVHNGTARWSDAAFGWLANWTIPRDAKVSSGDGLPVRYRFVVPAQEDPYRNDVPRHEFHAFEVTPYDIPLVFTHAPVVVERTQKATWLLNLTYADGKPFTLADNASQLRVCFFPASELRSQLPCLNRPTVALEYAGRATWRVTQSWTVTEARVGQDWVMAPAWSAEQPARDKDGNTVASRPFQHFNLSVASPRVTLVTQVGDERREGPRPLERGDLVKVSARILYPDGTTPFNRTRNADGRVLPLLVVERNSIGDQVAVRRVELTNPGNRELWVGEFELGHSAEDAPAGRWQLRLDVEDTATPPNANATLFERNVVPASILVSTTREPPTAVRVGETIQYRFRLAYRDGTHLTGDDPGAVVRAEVRPVREHGLLGPPVQTLAPAWDAFRDEWVAEWQVPRSAALQRYVIVPSGTDLYGNVVRSDVTSRAIQLYTEVLERGVITEPVLRIPRGDAAVVVFDGREGDVGLNGTGLPAIQVQRYDSTLGWLVERFDVRAADEPGHEHVGIWNTTLTTQAGTYRFALVGKDSDFAVINATSRDFLVEAVRVTRASIVNGTNVTKGADVYAAIDRSEGDIGVDAYVVQDGKRFATVTDRKTLPDRIEARWTVPFTFPTGAFTIVIQARDRSGNDAYGEVGPFFVSSAGIRSETVTDPVRIVPRGEEATWSFRSFYLDANGRPTDQRLDGRSGVPEVTVHDANGPIAAADVRTESPNYVARWEVPPDAEITDFWFEAGGRDAFGNVHQPLRSAPFRTEPGQFGRTIALLPPTPNPRDVKTGFHVYTDPLDAALEYVIVKLRADSASAALNNFQGQVVHRGDVQLSADGQYWIAEWTPPKDAPLGWYRFRIQGTDQHGNLVEQYSGAWQMAPSQLPVFFRNQPRTIQPGEPFTVDFEVTYPDRTPLSERLARLNAQVYKEEAPIPPEATLSVNTTGRSPVWTATWDTPDVLAQGRYRVVVSGFDLLGNVVLRTGTNAVDYAPTNLEKLLGVPAPGALLALLAGLGAAFVLRRRAV